MKPGEQRHYILTVIGRGSRTRITTDYGTTHKSYVEAYKTASRICKDFPGIREVRITRVCELHMQTVR